jgi:ribosomal protein S18 acetylase RimI-like enzyme
MVQMTSAARTEELDGIDIFGFMNSVKQRTIGGLGTQEPESKTAFLHPGIDRPKSSHPLGMQWSGVVSSETWVGRVEHGRIRMGCHLLTLPQVSTVGRTDRVHKRGEWPGKVELVAGWAKAVARPWNDDIDAVALRLERGGARFLRAAADLSLGWSAEVLSPATLPRAAGLWKDAGFAESNHLLLLEHDLSDIGSPTHEVEHGNLVPLDEILAIDQASFDPRWRLGRLGLTESFEATWRAVVLRIRNAGGQEIGFAICGISLGTAYLQRLAVAPDSRLQGLGRSLVSAAIRWARRRGARSMLLNTQTDNSAADLYRRMGFNDVPGGLLLFRYRGQV